MLAVAMTLCQPDHADIRLLEHGGIYLDIDTFIIRPFADHSLMLHDTVMGMEAHSLSFLRKPGSDDEMLPKGLCNAVIILSKVIGRSTQL
jgi:hypothetical protein